MGISITQMQKQFAHKAVVQIGENEYDIGINRVTIDVFPVFNKGEGLLGYTLDKTEGLPTEDPNKCHALNVKFGDADPGKRGWSWHLSKDADVQSDGEEVLIRGSTEGQGNGYSVETRIPKEAVEFQWAGAAEKNWIRHKHLWEDKYESNPYEEDPTFDFLFGTSNDEEQDIEEKILNKFEEFADRRSDVEFDEVNDLLKSDKDFGAVIELDVLLFQSSLQTSVIHNPDPEKLVITENPYDLNRDWETYAMPGAFEGHTMNEVKLAYHDGDSVIVVG